MKNYAITTARYLYDEHKQEILQFETMYAEYLAEFDFQLLILPSLLDVQILTQINPQLVLLPGGGDVPAEYYDSNVDVVAQKSRDLIEDALISYAVRRNIPILGICRGMQMLNGYFGGKLTRGPSSSHPVAIDHSVRILGCEYTYLANSYHRDFIQKSALSKNFEAIAIHENCEHVEAFVGANCPVLGLQWHPERMDQNSPCRKYSSKLIKKLISKGNVI